MPKTSARLLKRDTETPITMMPNQDGYKCVYCILQYMFHFLQEANSMEVLENESRTRILKEFEIVRSTTMNLVKTLEADDYVQTAPYTSPPKWHIGHTSWIYRL